MCLWRIQRQVLTAALMTGSLLLVASRSAPGADWYVDAAAEPGGTGSAERPFLRIADATAAAGPGDRILLAEGIYSHTVGLEVDGFARRALLMLPDGVEIVGAGRERTLLVAPASSSVPVFGITAADVGPTARVSDLGIRGPCFQGINLRNASPVLERLDVQSDEVGASSVAFDARDGSAPLCRDLLLDGGHSALFIEFGSAGRYEDCFIGRRRNEGVALSNANPTLLRCVIEGQGRDTLVLNQDSRPVFRDCTFGRGDRWTVRVTPVNQPGTLDLSGNRWFSADVEEIYLSILDATDDLALGLRVDVEPTLDPLRDDSLRMGEWKLRFGRVQSANQGQ